MTTTKPPKKRKKGKKGKDREKDGGWLTAKKADRHELYELSVQEPESECDLIDQAWEEQRGRRCESIREDFCGTAVVCMEWVKRRRVHTAVGVDLDPSVLKWGRHRIPQRLTTEQASRITLIEDNVLTVETEPVDSVLAMNFSYYLLRTRAALREYFERAHAALKDDGMFLLDAYGGSDSFLEMEEERDMDGFTYIWDQNKYNPITGGATNYIHFSFPDGSSIRKAFEYEWRLWTLPEIREVLLEAGFGEVVVYWEGTDEETEEGDGEFTVSTEGEACPGWVAYLVAKK
jgi:SAM-dependent methyltransferase